MQNEIFILLNKTLGPLLNEIYKEIARNPVFMDILLFSSSSKAECILNSNTQSIITQNKNYLLRKLLWRSPTQMIVARLNSFSFGVIPKLLLHMLPSTKVAD